MFPEFLYQEVTSLRMKIIHLEKEMQSQTWFKKLQALMGVIGKIRESLDLETIFKTPATEVRQLLNADRVAVYRFIPESDWNEGEVVSEDVLPQYSPSLGAKVHDRCYGVFAIGNVDRSTQQFYHLAVGIGFGFAHTVQVSQRTVGAVKTKVKIKGNAEVNSSMYFRLPQF